jgi:hypothetical protein
MYIHVHSIHSLKIKLTEESFFVDYSRKFELRLSKVRFIQRDSEEMVLMNYSNAELDKVFSSEIYFFFFHFRNQTIFVLSSFVVDNF